MWRPGRSRRFAAARAHSSSAGVYPRCRASGGTLDSTTGTLGPTGRPMAYSLGIDLGTTYSAAATARDGRIEIFQLGERAATIPSIVLLRADGEVLVGDAAERRSLS